MSSEDDDRPQHDSDALPPSVSRFAVHTHDVTESRHYFDVIPPRPRQPGARDDHYEHCLNPVELILAALGASQEITYHVFAERLGVELHRVSVQVSGDIDLGGFFSEDRATRPGFQRIEVWVYLDSPAPATKLQQLVEAVTTHCPMLHLLCNGTTVDVDVRHSSSGHAA